MVGTALRLAWFKNQSFYLGRNSSDLNVTDTLSRRKAVIWRERKIKITRSIKWYLQFIIRTVSKLGAFKFKTDMNVKGITLQNGLGSEILETFVLQLVGTMGVSR